MPMVLQALLKERCATIDRQLATYFLLSLAMSRPIQRIQMYIHIHLIVSVTFTKIGVIVLLEIKRRRQASQRSY